MSCCILGKYNSFIKKLLLPLWVLLPLWAMSQYGAPYDHYGEQYATQGTDFWVCFPRTIDGMNGNKSKLYVVSERECDVTVSAPQLNWSKTAHIMPRVMCSPDSNYILIPESVCRFLDTVHYPTHDLDSMVYDDDYTQQPINHPQPQGFHVTSTDTISLFISITSMGSCSVTNVLPTELLRDEYVMQLYPRLPNVFDINETDYIENIQDPPTFSPYSTSHNPPDHCIDIVAVEDSTVVDITVSDWDFMNRRPGTTFSVVLNQGELYHLAEGEFRDKYYPLFYPFYYFYDPGYSSPIIGNRQIIYRHSFDMDTMVVDTFMMDLSGTRVKARDCKRLAIFENQGFLIIKNTADMLLEQSVPIRYEGKEFLLPHPFYSDTFTIRFTGLYNNTSITIRDASRTVGNTRIITVNAYETNWFQMMPGEGPFYIQSSRPIITKGYLNNYNTGDESFYAVTPVEWWHGGQVNYGTITAIDENFNHDPRKFGLYIFTRTADVPSLRMDSYDLNSYFHPIAGTPYSYACFSENSSFNSEGTHHIKSLTNSPFMATMTGALLDEQVSYNLPHVQPGGVFLKVNGVYSDSLNPDSLWCHYDPVSFYAWNNRPCDSVYYCFSDGTTLSYFRTDPGFLQPHLHTFPDTGVYSLQCIFIYEDEGCFTRHPDTVTVALRFGGHVDTSFSAVVCDGTFHFRGHEFDQSGMHEITTYWTQSGCDTLWHIDLTLCPHCHWEYDTVAPDELPVYFNGNTYNTEIHDDPIYISIPDTCDSIIFYTLIVIPSWGDAPIDSVWIQAPNVITPNLETNNIFAVACSHHILKAEVSVYNRYGSRVARFDGLTGSWDGTHQGQPCQQGTYVYHIRYIDTKDNNWKVLDGTVTLIR